MDSYTKINRNLCKITIRITSVQLTLILIWECYEIIVAVSCIYLIVKFPSLPLSFHLNTVYVYNIHAQKAKYIHSKDLFNSSHFNFFTAQSISFYK